jgi:hypothetical protein
MAWHTGDTVVARRMIDEMDVETVPEGAPGTVEETTVFGQPKVVCFEFPRCGHQARLRARAPRRRRAGGLSPRPRRCRGRHPYRPTVASAA